MFSGLASAFQLTYLLGSLTTIQSYICQPPTAPLIVTPVDGTSVEATKPFTVSGDGPFQSAIVLSSNGTDIVSVQADDNNHFSAQVTLANEGSQTITARSERTCGTSQGNAVTLNVTPAIVTPVDPTDPSTPTNPTDPDTPTTPGDNEPNQPSSPNPTNPSTPTPQPDTNSEEQGTSNGLYLSIQSPSNNSTTTDSSIFVNGSTDKPSKVSITINGQIMAQTFINSSTFGLNIPLTIGVNELTVTANAETGSASVKLTVTRQSEDQKIAWYQTEQGQTAIRIAIISLITILIIIVIIGIILL